MCRVKQRICSRAQWLLLPFAFPLFPPTSSWSHNKIKGGGGGGGDQLTQVVLVNQQEVQLIVAKPNYHF